MAATREELQRRVEELEADMPALIAEYPDPGDFNSAFAGRADEITDHVGRADDAWAFEQLNRIVTKHGLWRTGQDKLPPDE